MQTVEQPDHGMELCYECEGEKRCIMCRGEGEIAGRPCGFCGKQKRCIVCNGAGQLTEGTYADRVDRGLIKEWSQE